MKPVAGIALALLTGVLLARCSAPSSQPAQSTTHGEFIVLRHGDTVRIERFTATARVVRTEILNDDGERDQITAWIGAGGYVDSLLVMELDGDSRWSQRTVFGSASIRIATDADGKTADTSVSTTSRTMPFYDASLALAQLLIRQAQLAPREKSRTVLGASGRVARTFTVSRIGDTLLVADNQRLLWLATAVDGAILGGRTRTGEVIVSRTLPSVTPLPTSHAPAGWLVSNGGHQIGKCGVSEHSYPPSPLVVQLDDSIDGAPTHLRSDGRGPYVHRADGVLTHMVPLMELYVRGHPALRPPQPPNRAISFDLSQPVAGSGARALGTIRDSGAVLAAFYRKDRTTDMIVSPKEMTVGEEVPAARVELGLHLGGEGERHLSSLSFGPFPRGYCEEAVVEQVNAGSTQPTMKRTSSTTWVVTIPRGSIGRLWYDISGEASSDGKTEDRGLYQFSGRFQFTLLR